MGTCNNAPSPHNAENINAVNNDQMQLQEAQSSSNLSKQLESGRYENSKHESRITSMTDTIQKLQKQLETANRRTLQIKVTLQNTNRRTLQNKNSIIQAQFNKIAELENELKRSTANKEKTQINIPIQQETKVKKPNALTFTIESKPDILVYGYINTIGAVLHALIIPKDIINLCYLFYYQDMNLILLSGSKKCTAKHWNEGQYIKLYHIEKQYKRYYINIQSVADDDDHTMDDRFDRFNYGQCISSHISLPGWNVVNKYPQISAQNNKIGKYQSIMRCGGQYAIDQSITNECDMILFDADSKTCDTLHDDNVMNGYHIQLPSLPISVTNASVLYDDISSTLYCIGGRSNGNQRVSSCVFDMKLNSIDSTEWRASQQLNVCRYGSSLCMISDYNVIAVIGGKSGRREYNDNLGSMELVATANSNNNSDIVACSEMNYCRFLCGSCYNNVNGNKIIVGGGIGYGATTSVEYLDLNKDKWISLKYETNRPHRTPFIRYDIYNPNIIYIGSDSVGNHPFTTLGFIEWIDIRDRSCKFWNYLFDRSIQEIFDLHNDIPMTQTSVWKSRSLMLS